MYIGVPGHTCVWQQCGGLSFYIKVLTALKTLGHFGTDFYLHKEKKVLNLNNSYLKKNHRVLCGAIGGWAAISRIVPMVLGISRYSSILISR